MRSELLLKGVNPGKLFSPRDHTLRGILSKTKVAESHQLKALMAASAGDLDIANESFSNYVDAQWYSKVKGDRNDRMIQEYDEQYRNMKPTMHVGPGGELLVKGLNNGTI